MSNKLKINTIEDETLWEKSMENLLKSVKKDGWIYGLIKIKEGKKSITRWTYINKSLDAYCDSLDFESKRTPMFLANKVKAIDGKKVKVIKIAKNLRELFVEIC